MQFSEKELEDMIFEDLTKNYGLSLDARGFVTPISHLNKVGLYPKMKWLTQVELPGYGILDIVGYHRYHGRISVSLIELKVVPLKADDFDQVLRYKTAIQEFFGGRFDIKIFTCLVGPSINSGHYIHNHLKDFVVTTYDYSLDGINFEMHSGSWCRTDANKKANPLKIIRDAEKIHGY